MYYDLEIPPKQTAVIVHVQVYRQQFAAACAILNEIKDKEYLAQLPADLQKRVVNFPVADGLIGDLEILRGGISDRKSTRLNSSHGYISYAVFCLKKKIHAHRRC